MCGSESAQGKPVPWEARAREGFLLSGELLEARQRDRPFQCHINPRTDEDAPSLQLGEGGSRTAFRETSWSDRQAGTAVQPEESANRVLVGG